MMTRNESQDRDYLRININNSIEDNGNQNDTFIHPKQVLKKAHQVSENRLILEIPSMVSKALHLQIKVGF